MWDVIIIIIIIIIHHGEINPYGCIVLGFMDTSKGVRKQGRNPRSFHNT
jgi:hypothetical protein